MEVGSERSDDFSIFRHNFTNTYTWPALWVIVCNVFFGSYLLILLDSDQILLSSEVSFNSNAISSTVWAVLKLACGFIF